MVKKSNVPAAQDVPNLTEHLFRHESGRLVSILTGIFGIERLQLAEDVVQEALVRALQTWPYYGVPQNPTGWIMQTAKHLALDVLRREKRFYDKQPEMAGSLDLWTSDSNHPPSPALVQEIKDDQLRLMFTCCHPEIPQEAQTALALKTLCGFSPAEIAKAFLSTEAAILKRLTRARSRISERKIPFEIPAGNELAQRLDSVLQIIYLSFNEGYKATSGDCLVRESLCYEAIRLGLILAEHPVTGVPRTHALVAMMMLHGARLPARSDSTGNILQLQDQDRNLWDRVLVENGMTHLGLAAKGDQLSEYHIQAGIAAHHSMAPSYNQTDWSAILGLYDAWLTINDSPVVALNRAVALANVDGPAAGRTAVEDIRKNGQLENYYLTYAVLGEFEMQLINPEKAVIYFQRAIELTGLKTEQDFLRRKLQLCKTGSGK